MTAKEYLQQVKSKDATIHNLTACKEYLEEILHNTSGGTGKALDTLSERIKEKERKIDEEIEETGKLKLEVIDQLKKMPDKRLSTILYKRYIEHKAYEMIGSEIGYCCHYTIALHKKALKEFQKVLDRANIMESQNRDAS